MMTPDTILYKNKHKWIEDIPKDWSLSRIRFVLNTYTGNSLNEEEKDIFETFNPNDIPYVSSKDISLLEQTVNYNSGLRIPKNNTKFKISPKGSFLMVVEGGSSGKKIVFLEEDVCFVNKLCSFNSPDINKYSYYYFQSTQFKQEFDLYLNGLIGGVSLSSIKDLMIPVPPENIKSKIVSYLDKRTKEIISLIKRLEKKIKLLEERKESLIHETITKGLNSNIEMKETPFEWIDKIPHNWEVKRLRFLGKLSNGLSKDSDFFGRGNPFYTYGDVYNNTSLPEIPTGLVESDEQDIQKCSVERGDIFFTRTSETTDDIGITSVCLKTIPNSTFSGFVIRFRPFDNTFLPEYSKYIFQNNFKKMFIDSQMNLVTRSSLSQIILSNIPVIYPTNHDEQREIIEYLDLETKKIDKTIKIDKRLIDLLKKYKTSLISETVIGKTVIK